MLSHLYSFCYGILELPTPSAYIIFLPFSYGTEIPFQILTTVHFLQFSLQTPEFRAQASHEECSRWLLILRLILKEVLFLSANCPVFQAWEIIPNMLGSTSGYRDHVVSSLCILNISYAFCLPFLISFNCSLYHITSLNTAT